MVELSLEGAHDENIHRVLKVLGWEWKFHRQAFVKEWAPGVEDEAQRLLELARNGSLPATLPE